MTNKNNDLILMFVCFIMTLFLGGCSSDIDIENKSEIQIRGDIAKLTFMVGESFDDALMNTRSKILNDTIREKLGDRYILETVITPEKTSALTRAETTTTVADNVKILVIAYRGNKLYKREVATVSGGKFSIHLPVGETFKLRFYAHNVPNQPVSTDFCTGIWTPGNTSESGVDSYIAGDNAMLESFSETPRDMMWAKIDAINVTSTTKLPAINFKHLFCKVSLSVNCEENMTAVTAVLGPQSYSNATADISTTDAVSGWTGTGTRMDAKISGTSSGAKNISGEIDLIPYETGNMTLKYEKITINGINYKTSTPKDLGQAFRRGGRYTITSTVKTDDMITITYDANGGIMPDGNKTTTISVAKGIAIDVVAKCNQYPYYQDEMGGIRAQIGWSRTKTYTSNPQYLLKQVIYNQSYQQNITLYAIWTNIAWSPGFLNIDNGNAKWNAYNYISADYTPTAASPLPSEDCKDYFPYNSMTIGFSSGPTKEPRTKDPCKLMGEKWRLPTSNEAYDVVRTNNVSSSNGFWRGTKREPESSLKDKYLYFAYTGAVSFAYLEEGTLRSSKSWVNIYRGSRFHVNKSVKKTYAEGLTSNWYSANDKEWWAYETVGIYDSNTAGMDQPSLSSESSLPVRCVHD